MMIWIHFSDWYSNSVLEIHAFVVQLVGQFEFEFATPPENIRREACGVMTPTLKGDVAKGTQLPLRVKLAPSDL